LTELAGSLAITLKALEKVDAALDDTQLANVDLQNILQKQQQTLQMMSNEDVVGHRAVIRKIERLTSGADLQRPSPGPLVAFLR